MRNFQTLFSNLMFCRKWALEKLVFRNIRERKSYDCKYAIQPRKAMATGIHRSGHLIGSNATMYADPLSYYHYHNTINKREEVCQEFIDPGTVYVNPRNKDDKFVYDDGMVVLVEHIKEFEMDTIGPQPFIIWREIKPPIPFVVVVELHALICSLIGSSFPWGVQQMRLTEPEDKLQFKHLKMLKKT